MGKARDQYRFSGDRVEPVLDICVGVFSKESNTETGPCQYFHSVLYTQYEIKGIIREWRIFTTIISLCQ